MSQRLGVAAALLGDPQVLLLDEPVNGLDPEGVLWIRNLMKHLASQGKTVLVSSHLMNEMAVTADHLIVIGRGRLLADAATDEVIARGSGQSVRVRTPDPDRLTRLIQAEGGSVAVSTAAAGTAAAGTGAAGTGAAGSVTTAAGDGRPPDSGEAPVLTVTGLPAPRIGELAASASIVLHELTPQLATLEDAFLELTADSLEFGHFGSEPPAAVTDGSPR
jgi:ABC-2 type transport system ATP-binding protein